MIKAILFDLDGTLLPMDQDEFTKGYFKLLAAKLAPYGYEPKTLIDTVWAGTAAMVKNTGAQTNEAAFWERFSRTPRRFIIAKSGPHVYRGGMRCCGFGFLSKKVDTTRLFTI